MTPYNNNFVSINENIHLSCIVHKVIGVLTADLFSGIVHWVADSYGSVDMFLIGKVRHFVGNRLPAWTWAVKVFSFFVAIFIVWQNLLRNFREHHIDPTAITRHDFIETNGDNFAFMIPPLAYLAFNFQTSTNEQIQHGYNWHLYLFLLLVFVSMTNQVIVLLSISK